jgi:hypothetical protein
LYLGNFLQENVHRYSAPFLRGISSYWGRPEHRHPPDVVQSEMPLLAREATDRHVVAANQRNKVSSSSESHTSVGIERRPVGRRPKEVKNRAPCGVVENGDGSVVALEEEVDGGDVGGHQVPPRRLRVERLLCCSVSSASFFLSRAKVEWSIGGGRDGANLGVDAEGWVARRLLGEVGGAA